MVIQSIIGALITIFLLIIPGVIFQKKNVITKEQGNGINSVIMNLTWPCLVIDAMQMEYSKQILEDSVYAMIVCLLVFLLIYMLTVAIAKTVKMEKKRQYLLCFMLLFGNTGFIGIPVMKALYGGEAVFYAAIIELINDVLIFTVGILMIQKSAGVDPKMKWKELLSPGMVGVMIGLGLFLLQISLPEMIGQAVEMIGNATTPLTMFMIGIQLGELKWKDIVGDIQVYLVSLLKLLLIPVMVLMILRWKTVSFTLLEKTLILSFAMPVGSVAAIFTKQYKSDVEFAAKSVLISTVLCMLSIPIFAVIMEL